MTPRSVRPDWPDDEPELMDTNGIEPPPEDFSDDEDDLMESEDDEEELPLIEAVESNDIERMRQLLEDGADVNERDASGTTAFMCAIAQRFYDGVVLLSSYGADVNLVNSHGNTALMDASRRGLLRIVALLLGRNGHKSTVKLLLEHEAEVRTDVNAVNVAGSTALMCAIAEGFYDIAVLLVAHGADVNLVNNMEVQLSLMPVGMDKLIWSQSC